MSKHQESLVNQRFKEVYQELEHRSLIKGKSDLANELGTYNHIINSILKGQRNITIEQLNLLFLKYKVNANFIFGLNDAMFMEQAPSVMSKSQLQYEPNANIVLIPHKALAGHAINTNSMIDQPDLPRFSIPNLKGELIGVEISGDSMYPTLVNGDIVVCEPIERGEALRENHIYVIVTDVVVAKRIQQIKAHGQVKSIRLISDNDSVYKPYDLNLEDISQLLRVKCRLTGHGMG